MLPTIVFVFIGGLTITLVLSAVKRSYNFNHHQLYQSGFCLALYQLYSVWIHWFSKHGSNWTRLPVGFHYGHPQCCRHSSIRRSSLNYCNDYEISQVSLSVANICDNYFVIRLNNDNISDAYIYNVKQKHKRPIVKSVKSIQVLTVFMIGAIVVSGLNQKLIFTNLILPLALLIYLVIDIYQSEHHQLIYATEQSRTPPEQILACNHQLMILIIVVNPKMFISSRGLYTFDNLSVISRGMII